MKNHSKFFARAVALLVIIAAASFALPAMAMTPTLTLSATGTGDGVQVSVTGDANSSVLLYYIKTNVGNQLQAIGNTDSSGHLSTIINSSTYGIAGGSMVYVTTGGLNGASSNSQTWPTTSSNGGTGNLTLSQTSLVLSTGQSGTINIQNNPASTVYLSNSSNPPVANVNISGNTLTVYALSNGSSTITVCASQSSTNTCASAYITVQNGSTQSLNFSMSNVTIAQGQSVSITISGGSGNYQVLTNSNSSAIQSNISGNTLTLTANSGSSINSSSAITVCTSDNSSCGIVNAVVGSLSTTPLTFSPSNPVVNQGQNLSVIVYDGNANYNSSYSVSSNSNTNVVQTSVSGNNLSLYGNTAGSATLTICSSNGNCGTLPVTVNYYSSGGTLQLSQTTASVLVGQVISVTVSGGTAPYSLSGNNGQYFQASINGNVVTLSGLSAGSGTLNVCSAMSACVQLSVTVNASGAGTALSFSQNNLSMNVGAATAVNMTGSGGYYVSNSSNQGVASVVVNGSTAIINALAVGNTNVSICQAGGQCSILFISVVNNGSTVSVPTFSQTNPSVAIGQNLNITVSGGSGSNYYVSANTNPSIVQLTLVGSQLTLTGVANGNSTVVVCASSSSCAVLNVYVNTAVVTPTPTPTPSSLTIPTGLTTPTTPTTPAPSTSKFIFKKQLQTGDLNEDVTELQQRLTSEGVYNGPVTGKFGALTRAAVKLYQKQHGIRQTGIVGPATMASLNK